jgi:hypothetical protein
MKSSTLLDRRDFLLRSSLAALVSGVSAALPTVAQTNSPPAPRADYTLRIRTSQIELAPGHVVTTTGSRRFTKA